MRLARCASYGRAERPHRRAKRGPLLCRGWHVLQLIYVERRLRSQACAPMIGVEETLYGGAGRQCTLQAPRTHLSHHQRHRGRHASHLRGCRQDILRVGASRETHAHPNRAATEAHKHEWQGAAAPPGQRQRQVHDRVECDRRVSTIWAHHTALDLTLHQVDHYRAVARRVVLPSIGGRFAVRPRRRAIVVRVLLVRRPNTHAVEVLVQTVEEERQQLLAVLLRVAAELLASPTD
mmetsp:Transcript_6408/g.25928  ORF Transcript_6408/g.25928 Transcript_6408/m.25928 type:complete len:235 (-) Transcript_6408:968-1672(-)